MTTGYPPAEVRFYVDSDLGKAAKMLAELRSDVTYAGAKLRVLRGVETPACLVTDRGMPDEEWIPIVARQGWVILTRDGRIQSRLRELQAVHDHGAKLVTLAGKEAIFPWDQLRLVFHHWERIEAAHVEGGPFVYSATRTTFRRLDLNKDLAKLRGGQRRAPRST